MEYLGFSYQAELSRLGPCVVVVVMVILYRYVTVHAAYFQRVQHQIHQQGIQIVILDYEMTEDDDASFKAILKRKSSLPV